MAQFVPDSTLFPFIQRRVAEVNQRNQDFQDLFGRKRTAGAVQRAAQFQADPNLEAQRVFRAQGEVLGSDEFALARDVALEVSGVDAAQTARGESVIDVGGRSFVRQGGAATFSGDIGELGGQLREFLSGQDLGTDNPIQAALNRRFDQRGTELFSTVNTLSGAQLNELVETSGLDFGQILKGSTQFLGAQQSVFGTEVTGQRGSVGDTERVIRGTIGQRQASTGLFQSQAAASAEAASLAGIFAGQQRQVNPTLVAGTIDPQALTQAGGVGGGALGTASQQEAAQQFQRFQPALAAALGEEPAFEAGGFGRRGQIRRGPLDQVFNPFDPIFGTFGPGSVLGA